MKLFVALLSACAVVSAADAATVHYSKSFPGSKPPLVSIEVAQDGTAVYNEGPQDQDPVNFKLNPATTEQIFQLVEKCERFKRPLESNLKVANMGKKTFRYTNGTESHEVTFNYSLDENAKLLADWFERLTETQQLLFEFERTVKFDRLGVNDAILRIEAAWDRNRLVGVERFLPLLDRVTKNGGYLNMARERAAYLAAMFRDPKPKPAGGE
jgi:hypothetical protein